MSRRSLYGKAQIIVGDRTTHDGIVLSGSRTSNWNGVPIARKGDAVWCPTCIPHVFEIAEGLENCKDHELPMAAEGHRTTCGAILTPGWTSFIRFSLGFSSARVFDISDLGNSKEILFWQMK